MHNFRSFFILIVFIISFIHASEVYAQDLIIEQFGPDDGLASSETYHILQDSEGYFWICTDRGIVKYDGYDFVTFDNSTPGIDDHTFFKGYQFGDEIWFTAYNQTITIYNKISKTFKTLKEHLPLVKGFGHIFKVVNYQQGFLVYFRRGHEALYINSDNFSNQILDIREHLIDSSKKVNGDTTIQYSVNLPGHLFLFEGLKGHKGFRLDDFNWFGPKRNRLKKKFFRNIPSINMIFLDTLDQKKLISSSTGLYFYSEEDIIPILESTSVSSILKDKDGVYWLSTLSSGIIKTQHISLKKLSLDLKRDKITSLKSYKNKVIAGTTQGNIYLLDPRGLHIYDKFKLSKKDYIYEMFEVKNELWINGNIALEFDHTERRFKSSSIDLPRPPSTYRITYPIMDDLILFHDYRGESVYSILDSKGRNAISDFKENVRSIDTYETSKLYIATLNGLFHLDTFNLFSPSLVPIFSDSTVRINKIKSGSDFLAIASSGSGFAIYRNDQPFIYDGPISSPLVNSMTLVGDSLVFLGTNKGIDKIRMNHSADSTCFDYICTYSNQDLLLSNYIHDLCFADNKIFYSCDEGLAWFHLNDTIPKIPVPQIHIDYLSLGDSIVNDDAFVFKNNQNDIAIHFTSISTKKPKDNFYKYFLTKDKKQGKIFLTDAREVRFNDLDYGQYTFSVAAQNYQETWSPYKTIDFVIKPHLFQTIWFKVLVSAIFLTAIYLTYLNRLRTIKKKETEKNKILQLEKDFNDAVLSSIQSQINPHFVFNALQSIQGYILKNDTRTASEYLSKFSTIMRAGLQFSSLEFIDLEDEISFLKNYLSIEKLRFPERFNFEIHFEPNLILEGIKIPPLVLQPILENAVKHAFLENDPKNLISVKFEFLEHQNCLSCSIKDNGVGFYNSNKLNFRQGQHISKGVSLVKRRLDLLKEKYTIGSYQLLSAEGEAGTIVIIHLPVN